jgi:hypothetical protein
METSIRDAIKQDIKKDTDFWERAGTKEIKALMRINADVLEETVTVIDNQGFQVEKKVLPRKYLHKIVLYEKLREHRRCKKNDYGERMLKLMKSKTQEK